MKLRILILIASSVVFCTGNAMASKQKKVDAILALLPTESQPTTLPTKNIQPVVAQNLDLEMTLLINVLYRDQHFERLDELKKQKRKNF